MKLGGLPLVLDARLHVELGSRPRALPLLLHLGLEAGEIHLQPALARNVGGQVDRKAIGVVQLEDSLAVEHAIFAVQCGLEHLHAVFQRLGEAFLLLLEDRGHPALAGRQFRIGLAHHARQVLDQQMKEGLLLPQLVAVPDSAANDPA